MLCVFGLDFSTGYCMLTKPSDHLFTCFFPWILSLFFFFLFIHLFIHRPPSDLVFVITELPHERFSRSGNGVFSSFTFVLFRRCFCFLGIQYVYTSSNLRLFSFFFLSSLRRCSSCRNHYTSTSIRKTWTCSPTFGRTHSGTNLFHIFFAARLSIFSHSSKLHDEILLSFFFFFFESHTDYWCKSYFNADLIVSRRRRRISRHEWYSTFFFFFSSCFFIIYLQFNFTIILWLVST